MNEKTSQENTVKQRYIIDKSADSVKVGNLIIELKPIYEPVQCLQKVNKVT